MDPKQAQPGEINGDAFDRFTIAHAAFGALMGYFNAPWWLAVGVASGWEFIENPLKDKYPQMFPHATHDHPKNAVIDSLAMMGGWAAVRRMRKKK